MSQSKGAQTLTHNEMDERSNKLLEYASHILFPSFTSLNKNASYKKDIRSFRTTPGIFTRVFASCGTRGTSLHKCNKVYWAITAVVVGYEAETDGCGPMSLSCQSYFSLQPTVFVIFTQDHMTRQLPDRNLTDITIP